MALATAAEAVPEEAHRLVEESLDASELKSSGTRIRICIERAICDCTMCDLQR